MEEFVYNITNNQGKYIRVSATTPRESIAKICNISNIDDIIQVDLPNQALFTVELLNGKKKSISYYTLKNTNNSNDFYTIYVYIPTNPLEKKIKEFSFKTKEECEKFIQQNSPICSKIIHTNKKEYVVGKLIISQNDVNIEVCRITDLYKNLNLAPQERFVSILKDVTAHNLDSVFTNYKRFPNGYMDSNMCRDFVSVNNLSVKSVIGGNCKCWTINMSNMVLTYKTNMAQVLCSVDVIGDNQ